MELSVEALGGLQLCGDSAHVSDKAFIVLVRRVCDNLLKDSTDTSVLDDEGLSNVDRAVLKLCFASLVTLVLEAAKHDSDASTISTILEDCKFTADRIDILNKIFISKKPEIQALLSNIGHTPPHIVDVDWRLDFYLKNNHVDKVNEPVYMVTLKTEEGGQEETKDVQFACSMEQLQDLVGKLKDACKNLEKASQL
ncbi:COMM domain-containing protein 3-like [Saccoglossus kowalevskii]|uniref:COMM domain-containing protein 3 n=1 Tax=Saccoglossus kowalevskii TaxID=10224 RepID=A0ABM0MAP3_SACKO|nr:PREDICTED: COMM domain-containing protein 3-like [Saccoglossus kowalevskii]